MWKMKDRICRPSFCRMSKVLRLPGDGHTRWTRGLIAWWWLACVLVSRAAGTSTLFETTADTPFTHAVVDRTTGRVYAAAINRLYQLTSELRLESMFTTGPVNDNVLCFSSDCQGYPLTLTPTVNKVLLLDHETQMLISCGSVFQGACRRHRLSNITEAEELIPVPVAANDATSSTVAFIGPTRYAGLVPSRVLYVATTNTRRGPYRDMVPAICSRSVNGPPPNLFTVLEFSYLSTARVDISQHVQDYFVVQYVHGFTSSDFVYVVMVQRRSHLRALEEWGYLTRLSRICTSDPGYSTYTEVTVQCIGSDGTDYNLLQAASVVEVGVDLARSLRVDVGSHVFVGAFTTSLGHTSRPGLQSALCLFPISEIDRGFSENIHLCFNGSMVTRNMDYIAGTVENCPQPGKGGNVLSFCSETLKINGSVPIVSSPVLTYINTTVTSVATITTGRHTVAFLGTDRGSLKEILLVNESHGQEFDEIPVHPGHPILPDLHPDSSNKHIYVVTPVKLTKVSVERCHQYDNCSACLQARSPYCGWCTLEKRCTVRAACLNSTISGRTISHWLSPSRQQCVDFQAISPQSLPITSVSVVRLTISQLPQLPHGSHYMCVFGNNTPTQAHIAKSGLECDTPVISQRPAIPQGKDHVFIDLAVRSSEINTDFVKKPFVFYKCDSHTTCNSCVTSMWSCNWCLQDNLCTHNASACSRSIIIGENSLQKSLVKGREHCPSFILQEEILLPSGVSKEVIVEVKNLPRIIDDFWCVLEIEGVKQHVGAVMRNNRIVCNRAIYSYQSSVGEMEASLTVLSRGDTFIGRTNVTLYKCSLLGGHSGRADCSLCLTQHRRYKCVWCGNYCEYREICLKVPDNICPPPHIDWVHPLSGPVEGGTLVTIEGSNLGTSLEDIQDKITIGGIPCVPVNYSISVRVVCSTGPSEESTEGEVLVGNRAGVTKAQEKFSYQVIELNDIHPPVGPKSGGTRLYLSGSNLNIGSRVEVLLDHLPCVVDRTLSSSSQISCHTTVAAHSSYNVSELVLRIDNANITLPDPFLYTEDPAILRISPLKSYVSGGRSITVAGTFLTSVQQPKMAVFHNRTLLNETVCEVLSSSVMVCPSPSVAKMASVLPPVSREHNIAGDLLEKNGVKWKFHIGFFMDGVQALRKLQETSPGLHSDLTYVPDPIIVPFNGIKQYKGELLVIEGHNLLSASTENEVSIFIGMEPCNITSLTTTQIVCLPPEMPPAATDNLGQYTASGLPMVLLYVGGKLRYRVGYLQYEIDEMSPFHPEVIGGIGVGVTLVVVLSVIIVAVLRHKSYQAEREYKRIQLQMDSLENSVRCECKQAFAELQTDMTDLTHDLEITGIPTIDHRTYVLKVFFPGISDHPLLHTPKRGIRGFYSNYDVAMDHFEQLLNNKGFLLMFIDTLEAQRSFTIRDRVNVASLIMMIFIEKMEYATEVLKTLLLRLIDKSVLSKHPQLMLRRTESVVEKMLTNWMALSMYLYLKEHAGNPLFLLYRAIKHQIQKGPIDAVTCNARYSLYEERLLREQVDYSPVTIQVIQEDLDEKVVCRVLDCDTITQAKSKVLDAVYKNTPFSLRPSVYDVDLEWRHGRGGHLTLMDEDVTTKVANGWKRLNTLKHYGVKESAVMSLVMKQNSSFSSNCTGQTLRHSLSPIVSPITDTCDVGINYWHLVKTEDDSLGQQGHKAIPEVYLTRLLSTKGIIQKFVDDCLSTILCASEALPPAIKWLFDLLDDAAMRYSITDPEVIHAWKSNSLPLRFWVYFIKNPDCILDIEKTPVIDSCLSVIAQTLMDACCVSEHRLGKDSPSTKLLFARDLPTYRKMVASFYRDIADLPPVTDQEMGMAMQALSLSHRGEFDSTSALKELYVYAVKYSDQIIETLETDPYCQKLNLAQKLENVAYTLEGDEVARC